MSLPEIGEWVHLPRKRFMGDIAMGLVVRVTATMYGGAWVDISKIEWENGRTSYHRYMTTEHSTNVERLGAD